jgi:hypothetical protein
LISVAELHLPTGSGDGGPNAHVTRCLVDVVVSVAAVNLVLNWNMRMMF